MKSENWDQYDKNESLLNKCLELADELLEINRLKENSDKISEEKLLLNRMFQEKLKKNLKLCLPLDKNYPKTPQDKSLEDELEKTLKIYSDSGLENNYEKASFIHDIKTDFKIYSDSLSQKTVPKISTEKNITKIIKSKSDASRSSIGPKEPIKIPKTEPIKKPPKTVPSASKTTKSIKTKRNEGDLKKILKTKAIKPKVSTDDKKPTKKELKKSKQPVIETFFSEDVMQKIRFLYYKVKSIEDIIQNINEDFKISDLNLCHEYINFLNVNYKTQSQVKILRELEVSPIFYDPIEDREIEIWDLMLECGRVLCILAKAYSQLSQKFESKNDYTNAITCMVECSKAYKTAAYFSAAQTRQEDIGTFLSAENLELKSEESRIIAQNLAIKKEIENLFLTSQLYSGLAALLNRFQYLKSHERIKLNQIKALISYYKGKSCHLKAKAIIYSSDDNEIYNDKNVINYQKKANYYFINSEEMWENLLKTDSEIPDDQKTQIQQYLTAVNEEIMENDVEMINSKQADDIPDPEPFIAIPENISYCIPKFTKYLMNFPSTVLEKSSLRAVSLEQGSKSNELNALTNQKAGIGRTIKQIKILYESGDIDINTFTELFEKYSTREKSIEARIEELKGIKNN